MVGAFTLAKHALEGKLGGDEMCPPTSGGGCHEAYLRGTFRIGLLAGVGAGLLVTLLKAASKSKA